MITKLLIICPLVFLAGFVDAIGGGGGLISLPAYMFAGLPPHNAIATNKISSCMGTTAATANFIRMGFIPWALAIPCIITAVCGSYIGARLSMIASNRSLQIFMLIFLPILGIYILFSKKIGDTEEKSVTKKAFGIGLICAFVIGIYDGFYGPGTGTFLVLAFTKLAKLDLYKASGMTKAINLTTNITSMITFILHGQSIIIIGVIAGVCSIAGNILGSNMLINNAEKIVRPIILTVITIFLIKSIYGLL